MISSTRVDPHAARSEPPLTRASDGTIIFSGPSLIGGSLLTARLGDDLGKPCLVLAFPSASDQRQLFVDWLASHRVRVLNVAGNRESNSPGIEGFVFDFIVSALKER